MHGVRAVPGDVSGGRAAAGAEATRRSSPRAARCAWRAWRSAPWTPSTRCQDEIHPIEVESYRIMAERVDLSSWPRLSRLVVARMIHASADLDYATTARCTDASVQAGIDAVRRGAPIICDAHMVRVGITGANAICLLDEVPVAPPGSTRSAAALRLGAERHPDGRGLRRGQRPDRAVRAPGRARAARRRRRTAGRLRRRRRVEGGVARQRAARASPTSARRAAAPSAAPPSTRTCACRRQRRKP